MNKFIKFTKIDDTIYKHKGAYWLKMTNIIKGEDRRIILNSDDIKPYPQSKALEEINNYWREFEDSWEFQGEAYTVKPINDDVIKNAVHEFPYTYTNLKGEQTSYVIKRYLVWHQGHIYWTEFYHYYPQCWLFEFKGINKLSGRLIKITNVNNLKIVFNKTKNKYA